MKAVEEMTHLIQRVLPELRHRHGVSDLWLFGSYIRAEQVAESDLDILVEFDNPHLSLIEFIQLEQELSQLLGIQVDLVERHTLKPDIGKRILQEAIAL